MSSSISFSDDDRRRWRLFNGKQHDPTKRPGAAGVPYFARRNRERILRPDDFMPVGEYAGSRSRPGKHMRAVPLDYLLWVDAQSWSQFWPGWGPVHDFIENYVLPDPETSGKVVLPTGPLFFTDRLRQWPTRIKCFQAGSSHLHCLPGYEEFLHALVVGGLHLSRDWYQPGALPHYDLTVTKHHQSLLFGAQIISDEQLIDNKNTWLTYFRTQPTPES